MKVNKTVASRCKFPLIYLLGYFTANGKDNRSGAGAGRRVKQTAVCLTAADGRCVINIHVKIRFMNKLKMKLEELNGNAFHLLGAFAANARQQGWSTQAIEAVRKEAMAGDYDHLLRTLIAHTDRPDEA